MIPELDFVASKQAARDLQKRVNDEARAHNANAQPNERKRPLLRDSVVQTYVEMLCLLGGHLATCRRMKRAERLFVVCNTTLAHKMGCNEATIWRRLNKMRDFGLIQDKRRHGSHVGVAIALKPDLVVPKAQDAKAQDGGWTVERPPLPRSLFTLTLQNANLQVWDSTVTVEEVITDSGSCGLLPNGNASTTGLIGGGGTQPQEAKSVPTVTTPESEQQGQKTGGAGRAPKYNPAVLHLLAVALTTLWRGQHIEAQHQERAAAELQKWYDRRSKLGTKPADLEREFIKRVQLVRDWLDKQPGRYLIRNVGWYFALDNPTGWIRTADWYNRWAANRKRNQGLYYTRSQILSVVQSVVDTKMTAEYHDLKPKVLKRYGTVPAAILSEGVAMALAGNAEAMAQTNAKLLGWIYSYFDVRKTTAHDLRAVVNDARAEYLYSQDPSN